MQTHVCQLLTFYLHVLARTNDDALNFMTKFYCKAQEGQHEGNEVKINEITKIFHLV